MKLRKMKKTTRLFRVVLAAFILASIPHYEVEAAEKQVVAEEEVTVLETIIDNVSNENGNGNPNARTFLVNCSIGIMNSSDGMLVECYTDSVGTASVLGVKDIKIQKKVWYGWKTVAVSEGAETENARAFSCHLRYTNAELGETYRVSCVHYGTVDSYTEVENQTEGFIFTY